jgi:phosphoglycolate phosphatase-like HAD superfamily hydrolase
MKVVVLDVDGTLMDTNYLHVEAWARAFERVEHRVSRWRIHRQIGKGSDKLLPEFVADGDGIRTVGVLTGGAFGEEALKAAGAVTVYEDCAALLGSGFPE